MKPDLFENAIVRDHLEPFLDIKSTSNQNSNESVNRAYPENLRQKSERPYCETIGPYDKKKLVFRFQVVLQLKT